MIGNVKFITTIVFGAILFEEKIASQQVAAIISVLLGLFAYSYYKIKEQEAEKLAKAQSLPTSSTTSQMQQPLISPSVTESNASLNK